MPETPLSPECFDRLRKFVVGKTGIAIADSKSYLVETRFRTLLESEKLDSFEALCDKLERGCTSALLDQIVDAITTNETLWFRDDGPWEIMGKKLLPMFCEQLSSGSRRQVKIWSAAASTGQEAYSVGMLIREYIEDHNLPSVKAESFQIVGTDISNAALSTARKAEYELLAASRGISPDRLDRFFDKDDSKVRVCRDVTSMVTFKQFDLQKSFMGLGEFDIILCRNVLIYFNNELKKEIYEKMSKALTADGALILGGAESVQGAARLFKMARAGRHLYYTRKDKGAE